MPTVLRAAGYRFFFYSNDAEEPKHIHVERENKVAKFWLEPIRLDRSGGFNRSELGRISSTIVEHRDELIEAWNEFFNN